MSEHLIITGRNLQISPIGRVCNWRMWMILEVDLEISKMTKSNYNQNSIYSRGMASTIETFWMKLLK